MSIDEQPLEIFQCEQGSEEWYLARAGIPTASEFQTLLMEGKAKGTPSATRRTYMLQLIGEQLTGKVEQYSNFHMERGKALEPEARDLYKFVYSRTVRPVGFIRRGRVGASPDALVDNDGLLEIKTKLPHLQIDLILKDQVPTEHKAQIQGQLWLADREWLDFVSYWPGLPLFVKRVERDEVYIETLAQAVDKFLTEMDETMGQLKEITFVEPRHFKTMFDNLDSGETNGKST